MALLGFHTRGHTTWGLMGVFYFVFISLLNLKKLIRDFIISVFPTRWKTFYFALLARTLLSNMVIDIFAGLQLFVFFVLFVFIVYYSRYLIYKIKNAFILKIRRVCLITFVTINLLGGFLCFFLGINVKAFIRANTKYAN